MCAKYCLVIVTWCKSLFDEGLQEIDLRYKGFLMAGGTIKCTEECARMHRKMCNLSQ
jgi:hypothetical protein